MLDSAGQCLRVESSAFWTIGMIICTFERTMIDWTIEMIRCHEVRPACWMHLRMDIIQEVGLPFNLFQFRFPDQSEWMCIDTDLLHRKVISKLRSSQCWPWFFSWLPSIPIPVASTEANPKYRKGTYQITEQAWRGVYIEALRRNPWSSIAQEDIHKVAHALARARRQAQEILLVL